MNASGSQHTLKLVIGCDKEGDGFGQSGVLVRVGFAFPFGECGMNVYYTTDKAVQKARSLGPGVKALLTPDRGST
jgi:hypothetical protein